jgi:TIR domain
VSNIFISYSQADRACAHELVAVLEAQGLKCWIAPRDISPSADWAAEIIDAITAARVMVLVFSASSNQSPQVRREVERAVHKGVTVLPFRIEKVVPSKSLEFFLSSQHWMDAFAPPREAHYRRLSAYLSAQIAVLPSAVPVNDAPASAMPASAMPAGDEPAGDEPAGDEPAREPAAPDGSTLGLRQLAHIELQLASYIGPLAKYLVRREAQRAAGTDELIARLSIELEAETDRATFVKRCQHPPGAS